MMDLAELSGFGGVPVVVAVVDLLKPFIPDKRLWPLVAVLIGIIWQLVVNSAIQGLQAETLPLVAARGLVVGLAASGLYSAVKTAKE